MSLAMPIPGLYYSFVRPPAEPSPLRTDVAGFLGRARRGPVNTLVRISGWREYIRVFGGLVKDDDMPYAIRGYFDNGGEVAHVMRLLRQPADGASQPSHTASAKWDVGIFDPHTQKLDPDWPGAAHFTAISFSISASSPGVWANDMQVSIRYRAAGASAKPELDFEISPMGEPPELLTGIDPADVVSAVNRQSAYIQLMAEDLPAGFAAVLNAPAGPRFREWDSLKLTGGSDVAPVRQDYLDALRMLGDQPEIALVAAPDLYNDLTKEDEQIEVLAAALLQAEQLHDRLVIVDVPRQYADALQAVSWVRDKLSQSDSLENNKSLRCAAVYHPRLLVPDPLGGISAPLRCVPCSGLVAGVISRLDLQFGAYYTPANAEIEEAVDLSRPLSPREQAALYSGDVNLLKCSRERGLLVWGGRTLGIDPLANVDNSGSLGGLLGEPPLGTPVAHRRLIHLLVRAIRRVAEPLVFDTNGPELWLRFVRSITTVLMEAFRAGALKGDNPDQAFRVKCDATTNPPENVDQGFVLSEIQIAPAIPMEFILLRVSASKEGKLEVFES